MWNVECGMGMDDFSDFKDLSDLKDFRDFKDLSDYFPPFFSVFVLREGFT